MVKLRLVSANSSSVISPPTYFCFKNGYNEAYNNKEDDVYLSSQTKELGLWSLARSQSGGLWTALFTDCLPLGEHEVNLGFCAPQAGEYIFSLNECYNETILSAVLWDKIENRTTDLLTQNYRFQTEAIGGSDSEDRFVLFFNKTFTAIDELQTSEIYAYADNNVLTVKNLLSGDNLQIVDVAGRTIASGVASGSEFFVTLNQKGVYIVNVKGKKTLKVLNK